MESLYPCACSGKTSGVSLMTTLTHPYDIASCSSPMPTWRNVQYQLRRGWALWPSNVISSLKQSATHPHDRPTGCGVPTSAATRRQATGYRVHIGPTESLLSSGATHIHPYLQCRAAHVFLMTGSLIGHVAHLLPSIRQPRTPQRH